MSTTIQAWSISHGLSWILGRTPLGWKQLTHNPARLAVAVLGVAFANILVFLQLGVMGALFETAVSPLKLIKADIMLMSPEARVIAQLGTLPRRRLQQALGVEGVASGSALYVGSMSLRSAASIRQANVTVFGVDPGFDGLTNPEARAQAALLRQADTALIDRLTRQPFTEVARAASAEGGTKVEVAGRRVTLVGNYALGASFESDGTAIVSDQTFLRLFPRSQEGTPNAILLQVAPGFDPQEVAARIADRIPPADTQVMTKAAYATFVKDYMRANTPIGFIFTFGVVIGLLIGFAIVYQILSADVHDHLAEYATFKAIGFTNGTLLSVVFEEAFILAVLGFVPGLLGALGLYALMGLGTELAVDMPWSRPPLVLALTFAMCAASGALATLRLRAADPADVF
jgi:putative ABC transport system permease protein